ncbi:MAG TPA: aconitate hydratase [Nitrososphaera sp.]|nr:aconitate hydratase [Nitrososphaera sp.]
MASPMNLAQKIISSHLADGRMEQGQEIGLKVDRVLMQDATGTMACLQFEAMGIPRVKVEHAAIYVDHNILQTGFENGDDHRFLQTFAAKYGIYYSKPGNGICHQVNLERFSVPGKLLIGSDSHTPTAGGAGMMAIGVGGLDVAVAMAGAPFYTKMPKIVGVKLTGRLRPWVTAKDVILEMLRRLTVKGGVGKIFEYYGEGIKSLGVPQRGTICNMGAELGATTSLFESDEITLDYMTRQGRPGDYARLAADPGCSYDENMEINLSDLEPLIALPGSPDAIHKVRDVQGTDVQQVLVGSCTNSSYVEMMTVAHVLKGKKIHPDVTMAINPGSKQVLETVARDGSIYNIIASGARLLESGCQGCIGMGSAPGTDWVSIRSFNRNWPGRSGTKDDRVYLTSPEVCVACAVTGKITDPRDLGEYPNIPWPDKFVLDDSGIMPPLPAAEAEKAVISRGPNIRPLPLRQPMEPFLQGEVLIRVGDNISTDAIMPAGAKILPLRSNVPAISEYVFYWLDPDFAKRAKEKHGGFIVGGENYGQGSSREHAALAPMYLGVKAVVAKSFARIHRANLINFGILPLEFQNSADFDSLEQGTPLLIDNVIGALKEGGKSLEAAIGKDKDKIVLKVDFTQRQRNVILAGGLLNYIRSSSSSATATTTTTQPQRS